MVFGVDRPVFQQITNPGGRFFPGCHGYRIREACDEVVYSGLVRDQHDYGQCQMRNLLG